MAPIRIYTDEDVNNDLAEQLRLHGYDALSCHDAGNHNQRLSDEWQLQYAASHDRAIVTRNIIDFTRLEQEWKDAGREHAGIICIQGNPTMSRLMRRLRVHLDSVSAEQQHNTLMWG